MFNLLPLAAIVVVGLIGPWTNRQASLNFQRLVIGVCTLVMLVTAFTDPTHRYISMLFVLLGTVHLFRLKATLAVG